MVATGVAQDGTKGVPVTKDLPIYAPTSWYFALFGNPQIPVFGSGDSWGYRHNVEVFSPYKFGIEEHLPLIGGKGEVGANLEYTIDCKDSGVTNIEGKGGVQLNIEPDTAPIAGGKIVAVVGGEFGVTSVGGGVYNPTFKALEVGIEGEVQVPTPWFIPFQVTIPIIGSKVGGKIYVLVIIKSTLKLKFEFEAEARPLPFKFESLTGTLMAGLQVSGELSAYATAILSGRGVFGPQLAYVNEKGFELQGLRIELNADLQFSVWGKEIVLHPLAVSALCTLSGCQLLKKRDAAVEVSGRGNTNNFVPISNVWNPKIVAKSPLTIQDVFPTGTMELASTATGTDMLVFTSFNPAIAAPNNLQIAYSVRKSGGQWSPLAFTPNAGGAVDYPAVAATTSTSFVLVTSVTQDLTSASLVYSTYGTNAGTWAAYKPLLPNTPLNVLDYMPIISGDGKMVAFVRNTASGSSQIMTTEVGGTGNFMAPVLVATTDSKSFSFDHSTTGHAILAFADPDTNAVTICSYTDNGNSWSCKVSSRESSSRITVLVNDDNDFVLVYGDDASVSVDIINDSGKQLHHASIDVPQNMRLTAAPSNLGDNSIVVGWEMGSDSNNSYHYCLVDTDGNIWYSPSLQVAHPVLDTRYWQSAASTLSSNGQTMVYASMMRSDPNAKGKYDGELVVYDLPYVPQVNIANVIFTPNDFTGESVTISATISNIGLMPLNAKGKNSISIGLSQGSQLSAIALVPLKTILPGESQVVTTKWNFKSSLPAGGLVTIGYTGTDDSNAEPYDIDPCNYTLSAVSVDTNKGKTSISVTLSAAGVCSSDVKVSATSRDANKPLEAMVALGKTTVTVSPNFSEVVSIPIDEISLLGSMLVITATGVNQCTTLTEYLPADKYDFGLDGTTFSVDIANPGYVLVSMTATNGGTTQAKAVPVIALLIASDGSTTQIASTTVDLHAMESDRKISLVLPLNASLNNVQFVINNPAQPTFPESFISDNVFNTAIIVPGGTTEGSYVNPSASSSGSNHKKISHGTVIAVIVVVVVIVLVIAVVAVILLLKLCVNPKRTSDHEGGHYTKLDQ